MSTAQTLGQQPETGVMQTFFRDGERRAMSLGNRGPIRLHSDGSVHQDILDAYWRRGFYVFEGVLASDELKDIEADVLELLDRLPSERGSPVDAKGRPALAAGCKASTLFWSKPLGDPFGGTDLAGGRHPVRMTEPAPAPDARRQRFPDETPYRYRPLADVDNPCRWSAQEKASLKDFNLLDLSI